MRYLLDTNAVAAVLLGSNAVSRRVRSMRQHEFAVSAIVAYELFFGAYNGQRTNETLGRIDELRWMVLDFDVDDARRSAEVRTQLQRRGMPIGPYDILIAGQALARDLTLVTRNTREFERIEGLRVENWEA